MTWHATTQVERFLAAAGPLLESDPVSNNALLTEASFWSRLGEQEPAARFGWWAPDRPRAAWVHLPDHPVLCSPLPEASLAGLPRVLAGATGLGVRDEDVPAVAAAWQAAGSAVGRVARISLLRLRDLRLQPSAPGGPRRATAEDLPLLRGWFGLFQQRHPEDPSHVAFVIDQPLADGGIVVGEVDGRPVAMASRTPMIAGMVRMGLACQPSDGCSYADSAFQAGCLEARRTAEHVLVHSADDGGADDEGAARHRALGFERVGRRVALRIGPG